MAKSYYFMCTFSRKGFNILVGLVFLNGYLTDVSLSAAMTRKEQFQYAEIAQKEPFFGWVVNSQKSNTLQTAYQIKLYHAPQEDSSEENPWWDTGLTMSNESVNIKYNGKPLEPNQVYYWKVKTWNNHNEESSYS